MKSALSIVAGILFAGGYIVYIASILKGETKPAKATWVVWAALDVILAYGMYTSGTLNGQMVGACLGATIVMVLALIKGAPGWSKLDKSCFAGAALGLVLWGLSGSATVSIVACLSVISIGSIPMMFLSWRAPYDESLLARSIFEVSSILAVMAIPVWSLDAAAQPIVFLAITTVAIFLQVFRRATLPPPVRRVT